MIELGCFSAYLGKDEGKVDSGFDSVLPMVVDVANPDVLLEYPENPLQLPAIADDVPKGHGLHAQLRCKVHDEIGFMQEGHGQDIPFQRWGVDCISLVFDPTLPREEPASMVLNEDCQPREVTNLGSDRPSHISLHLPVGGKPADQVHAKILDQDSIFRGDIGGVDRKGAAVQIGSHPFQGPAQPAKRSSQPLIQGQRGVARTFVRRGDDADIQKKDVEAIADDRAKRLDVDPDYHLLHRPAVEEAGPSTEIPSGKPREIIRANRDEMPALEGWVPGMPLPKMFRQFLAPPLYEPSEPSSGGNDIQGLVKGVFVDSVGISKVIEAVAVQKPGHSPSHDQPPVGGICYGVKH